MEALERGGEVVRVKVADLSGDLLDRQVTPLEEPRGLLHPDPLQELHRGAAEHGLEAPAEVAGAEPDRTRQRFRGVGLIESVQQALAGLSERAGVARRLAEQGRDPLLQLEGIERLVHIVIDLGPHRPEQDLLGAVAGQDQDPTVACGPEPFQGVKAVAEPQADVQQQQVDGMPSEYRQPLAVVGRDVDLIAVLQGRDDRRGDVGIVIDDQDLMRQPGTHHGRTCLHHCLAIPTLPTRNCLSLIGLSPRSIDLRSG